MKTIVKPDLKSKAINTSESFILLRAKEISSIDLKFYQKFFVVLISLSSILIFPESPRELENICLNHNDRELCKVC